MAFGLGGSRTTGSAGNSYLELFDGVPRTVIDVGTGSFARFGDTQAVFCHSRSNVKLERPHILYLSPAPELSTSDGECLLYGGQFRHLDFRFVVETGRWLTTDEGQHSVSSGRSAPGAERPLLTQ